MKLFHIEKVCFLLRVLITGYYISHLEISYLVLTQSRTKLRSSWLVALL